MFKPFFLFFVLAFSPLLLAAEFEDGNKTGNAMDRIAAIKEAAKRNATEVVVVNRSADERVAELKAKLAVIRAKRAEISKRVELRAAENDLKRSELASKQFGFLRSKLQERLDKVELVLERLKERDVDTSDLEAKLAAFQIKFDNFTANATFEDARKFYVAFKDFWYEYVTLVKFRAEAFEKKRLLDNVAIANGLLDKIELILSKLEARGFNVTPFEIRLAEIRSNLSNPNIAYGLSVKKSAILMQEVNLKLLSFEKDLRLKVLNERNLAKLDEKIRAFERRLLEARVYAGELPLTALE